MIKISKRKLKMYYLGLIDLSTEEKEHLNNIETEFKNILIYYSVYIYDEYPKFNIDIINDSPRISQDFKEHIANISNKIIYFVSDIEPIIYKNESHRFDNILLIDVTLNSRLVNILVEYNMAYELSYIYLLSKILKLKITESYIKH